MSVFFQDDLQLITVTGFPDFDSALAHDHFHLSELLPGLAKQLPFDPMYLEKYKNQE